MLLNIHVLLNITGTRSNKKTVTMLSHMYRKVGATYLKRCSNLVWTARGMSSRDSSAHIVDLRSDTITKPTPGMLEAMSNATFEDDVFREDPTVNRLQDQVADMFGMEKALFVPTGTMGNLISVMCHTDYAHGLEILLGDQSHIVLYEQGGVAMFGSVHSRTIPNKPDGTFDVDKIDYYIRPLNDPHQPWTGLICVENTHNCCGGKVLPLKFLQDVQNKANEYKIPVHMDGARVMNAAVHMNIPVKEITKYADSVNMCLSKGIGTPVGSMIAGTDSFIAKAIRLRKALGGGWRVPGMLAAAGLYALEGAEARLANDHKNAQLIAQAVHSNANGVLDFDLSGVHTNIVMMNITKPGLQAQQVADRLMQVTDEEVSTIKERIQVKTMAFTKSTLRFVSNCNLNNDDVELAIQKFKYVLGEMGTD